MLSCARDPEVLLRPSNSSDIATVREATILRYPNGEPTAEAVFANPNRRHRWDPASGEAIPHLALPDGAVWVTVGSCVDLARSRSGAADPLSLSGDDGVQAPVLELWLSEGMHDAGSGMRIAVVMAAGRAPAEIEQMLDRHLADETVVGVEMRDDDAGSGISRMALKVEAINLLRKHGHAHVRVADVPVSPRQITSRLRRLTILNRKLDAWNEQLKRFLANLGAPISAVTAIIVLLGGLAAAVIAVLHQLGIL